MTAMNIVHMRVKEGREAEFITQNTEMARAGMAGLRSLRIIKTDDREYCMVGEWDSYDDIVNARPTMITNLDDMRDMLEDLGDDRGVTEPYSGEAVLEISGR